MFEERIKKLRQILSEKTLDAFLVSNFYNILYLTGFKTLSPQEREAYVLVTKNNIYIFTDGRYLSDKIQSASWRTNSKFQMIYRLIEIGKGFMDHFLDVIKKEKLKRIAFEGEDLKFAEYENIVNNLEINKATLYPTKKNIIKMREIKDNEEIEKIKKACLLGDECLKNISKLIKVGQSEKEIVFKIEYFLKEQGYLLAFDAIVAVDENSAIPHYNTQDGKGTVKEGSIILIDFGVNYQNYLSDITRIFFYGQPSESRLNIYEKFLTIQEKTLEKSAKTNDPKIIDNFCRQSLIENQLPIYPHSTGHGIGLEIHEYPKISPVSDDFLQTNQVFTVEPGVYFPGEFGIRIEDSLCKSKNGINILTGFTKKPFII